MGKTNPQATGQSDAAAMGQVYQQLIAEQEANNSSAPPQPVLIYPKMGLTPPEPPPSRI